MRPTPIESPSLFSALEAPLPGPERAREPITTEPRAARFGQLFARVFGEQFRQPLAAAASEAGSSGPGPEARPTAEATGTTTGTATDSAAAPHLATDAEHDPAPTGLRALQIGEGTEIITAGPPPADEDLLRFARDTAMDEGSVAALLRHGRLVDSAHLSQAKTDASEKEGIKEKGLKEKGSDAALSPLHTAQEALIMKGQEGLPIARVAEATAPGSASPGSPHGLTATLSSGAGSAPGAARAVPGVPTGLARPQPSESGFSVSLAAGEAAPEAGTSRWMQSRAGVGDGGGISGGSAAVSAEGPHGEGDPITAGASKSAEIDPKAMGNHKFDFEALRLRLGLQDQSTKDRLIKILGPDAARAVESGAQTEVARLEAISLLEQPLDAPQLPPAAERPLGALTAESDGLAAMAGGGSTASGQGGGEGARPDPNASAQAGQPRSLPQQVMQRFGELLSQRLLQQVSQGNWRVELDLNPGDLGSIRIELELRKGEIEASIKATQASTRDLLQESLPRLREALERSGMDVASLSVGQQDRRQSGGQSSAGRQPSGGQASGPDQSSDTTAGTGKAAVRDDGRLDVWV